MNKRAICIVSLGAVFRCLAQKKQKAVISTAKSNAGAYPCVRTYGSALYLVLFRFTFDIGSFI